MKIKIIPAIDILDSGVVRLYQGNYNNKTAYTKSPLDLVKYYVDMGLNHIHVVDLNGAKDGQQIINLELIKSITKINDITIQIGGGIRTMDQAKQWFDHGIDYIILGSVLMQEFESATQIIEKFPNKVIAGLDVRNNDVAINGWEKSTGTHIVEVIKKLNRLPLHSIISTDIEKDGTKKGLNLSLYELLSTHSDHPIIASGGVSCIDDILKLKSLNLANVSGCIVGKAILDGQITRLDIQSIE